ncbi:MAG: thioredoxin family protein [Cyclobacteriaceae bacterium]|nr:thioredoxin family protein [Cyclobacteriaceae bacterium]
MGKDILFKAFRNEKTERTPWVPFVGCHGGKLIDVPSDQYLRSSALMVRGLSEAIHRYKPDGIPVTFDLQIEAEALGCILKWSETSPPAVISHPLAEGVSIKDLQIPVLSAGRIGVAMQTAQQLKEKHPDIALYGLVTGPFTLGLHLLGTDIFYKMMEQPEEIHELMEFTSAVCLQMIDYYVDHGCDMIALVDPMTSQIDQESFRQFVSGYVTPVFDHIRGKNRFSSFFVCGQAQQNIEAMCQCRPDNISIDENIPLDYVKEQAGKYHISYGGNLKLTMVLLYGTREAVMKEALECMDMGNNQGFVLSPGCDLPMDTPFENLEAIAELVHDTYQQDVIRTMELEKEGVEILNMRDYGKAEKVIVDIITLDSESCAPCQYMVEAVKRVAPQFEGIVEWREHPIKKIEGISFMSSLMVKNIPTICIDGKITFVSKIPPKNQLIEAIQKRINEKLKLKIKLKRGEFLIFGKDDAECRTVSLQVKKAMEEMGKEFNISHSTDQQMISSYGITQTPAVILTEHKLKSEGEIPAVIVIKEWIKEI